MKKILVLTMAIVAVSFMSGCQSTNASKVAGPLGAITKTICATPDVEVNLKEQISGEATMQSVFILKWGATQFADGVSYNGAGGAIAGEPSMLAELFGALNSLTGGAVEACKAAAAYDACQKANADVILTPNYVVTIDDFVIYKKINVKVTGYGGTIKGISKIEYVDYLREGFK